MLHASRQASRERLVHARSAEIARRIWGWTATRTVLDRRRCDAQSPVACRGGGTTVGDSATIIFNYALTWFGLALATRCRVRRISVLIRRRRGILSGRSCPGTPAYASGGV